MVKYQLAGNCVKNAESRSQYSRLNASNFLKVKVYHFNLPPR